MKTKEEILARFKESIALKKRVMEEAEWIILPEAIDMIANGRI